MPLYRTRLFETNPNGAPKSPFRARGWRADYRFFKYNSAEDPQKAYPLAAYEEARERHHAPVIIHYVDLPEGHAREVFFAPEIIIEASDRPTAQQAANLAAAAKTLLDGDFMTGEPFTAVPDDSQNLEGLWPPEYAHAIRTHVATDGVGFAMAIAAKATHRRRWTTGLIKHWLSLRTCSVPWIEHHPSYGTRFTVESDPINHAIMAQAIVTGYSTIEELDLHVKASADNPSKINGTWNPTVLADLQRRLRSNGIDTDEKIIWQLRNPPTRIERRHPPPAGERATWSRYAIRDRTVELVDAINYASLLRSKVSAHSTHSLTRSLTLTDVHNVQHVARRLLLESMGFWDRLIPKLRQRRKSRKRSQ